MEISPSLSVTIDIVPVNIEEIHRKNVCHCYRCLINLGEYCISLISCCVFIALPVIEIIIGSIYRNQCSANDFIPIYLIVTGVVSMIIFILLIFQWNFFWANVDNFKLKTILVNKGIIGQLTVVLTIFIILFAGVWFILGNIWVFGCQSFVQYTNSIDSPRNYCHRIVYLTSFGSIIIKYIFIWLILCGINCHVCFDIDKLLTKLNSK